MRGFSFLPANPGRPNRGSCAGHTDRSEAAPESVTDSRGTCQRRCGAGVPPCRHYSCRTHRSRIRTHRRGHDGSVSSRSVGLRQRKRACESEGCCQCDCLNFHEVSLLSLDTRQPHRLLHRSTKIFVRRDRSRQAVHTSQSPRCSSNRRPSRVIRLRRCSIAPGHNQSGSQLFPGMVQEFP
jgi:hypothetical protein